MIISRTPFRISFVGGGTDLPSFYQQEEGRVLSCAINKYLYVVVKKQIGIVEYKYRVNWSKVEHTNSIDDIEHPIVREALRLLEIDFPIEITTFAEVPSNTGLGSSSTFAVGLLHALHALKRNYVTKNQLAHQASMIEIDIIGRRIGRQDHYAASYGNLNIFRFLRDDSVIVEPVYIEDSIRQQIEDATLLFYTNLKRDASEILTTQDDRAQDNLQNLIYMRDLCLPLRDIITHNFNLQDYGKIIHQGWEYKKTLTPTITSPKIDSYYQKGVSAGAVGGKLLGAGGGGFIMLATPPEAKEDVIKAMLPLYHMPIKIDLGGTRITYYDNSGD